MAETNMMTESSTEPSTQSSADSYRGNGNDTFKSKNKGDDNKQIETKLDGRRKQGIHVAKKLRDRRKDEANQRRPWGRQKAAGDLHKLLTSTDAR
ncbi:hypothetical protein D9756_000724 [Leucocoprinus leucothites]|uniref:Uncharacterized protein n=1 Tax=Leucocoprinus leucothites TaxID=201217 RepID=A0A8H5GF65_9AGAR|nr:hypothetical protein D9756_000724 [Leucoagaricus leucothites]